MKKTTHNTSKDNIIKPLRKTPNASTSKSIVTKTPTRDLELNESKWIADYQDCFTFKMKPITEAFINRFTNEMVTWAETNEDALFMGKFLRAKGISRWTLYEWVQKYHDIKQAYDTCLWILGERREHGAIIRKYDSSTIAATMPHYSTEWKQMIEWKSKLAKDAEESGIKFVVIPSIDQLTTKKE